MKIKPLFNNILVKPVESEQVLMTGDKMYETYGEVIEVGPDVTSVKPKDFIFFTVWGFKDVEYPQGSKEKYFFVPDNGDFLLAKIDETSVLAE